MILGFVLAVVGALVLGWAGARLYDMKNETAAPPQVVDIGFYRKPVGGYVGWIETTLKKYFIDVDGGITAPEEDK